MSPQKSNLEALSWWRDSVVCPKCRERLQALEVCSNCGARFTFDGNTPRLIAEKNERTVMMKFDSSRSFVSEARLLEVFTYPPVTASTADLPYHVDAAHAQFISGLPKGAKILEIGCGGGQSRQWYLKHGFNYVGTDISKTRVPELLQRHGGPDMLCDVHFLPFADASVDVVYASAVFEHLACPNLAAQEIYRVLKPGGAFLGNASFLEPWHDHSYFHFSPLGAYETLVASGFTITHLWPGRSYSGFRALSLMALRKGLRWIGSLGHYAYVMQSHLLRLMRIAFKRPTQSSILDEAKIAGAIDWIAIKD
jgi:ubiquinone/menaquinone biosynthesis C-methylase UbiE